MTSRTFEVTKISIGRFFFHFFVVLLFRPDSHRRTAGTETLWIFSKESFYHMSPRPVRRTSFCLAMVLVLFVLLHTTSFVVVHGFSSETPVSRRFCLTCVPFCYFTASYPLSSLAEEQQGSSSPNDHTHTRPTASFTPFTPKESLVPALRVRRSIEKSLAIVLEQQQKSEENASNEEVLVQLNELWLTPQNFTMGYETPTVPVQPARQYLRRYQENINVAPMLAKPGAFLVGNGEIDAWRRLKRQEKDRESQDEVRSAFNIYTSNLAYNADSYLLNVPKEERSRMIREDRLPDIKQVIAADMDLRYLYRNGILTAIDDVRAELRYQQSQNFADLKEISSLLATAKEACDKWFSLVDGEDLKKALESISSD